MTEFLLLGELFLLMGGVSDSGQDIRLISLIPRLLNIPSFYDGDKCCQFFSDDAVSYNIFLLYSLTKRWLSCQTFAVKGGS